MRVDASRVVNVVAGEATDGSFAWDIVIEAYGASGLIVVLRVANGGVGGFGGRGGVI